MAQRRGQIEWIQDEERPGIYGGESAGGNAAVTAMFLNAEEKTGPKIAIDAVLLRFPMIKHYTRSFPPTGKVNYMGTDFTKAQVETHAGKVMAAVRKLDDVGLTPTVTSHHPPKGMAAAFLLSMTGSWQSCFQRRHFPSTKLKAPTDDPKYMDGLEHAKYYHNKVDQSFLPPIVIYHGHDDANCPVGDTIAFQDLMIKHYPGKYSQDQNISVEMVTEIKAKPTWNPASQKIVSTSTQAVGHGFDYSLELASEPFLQSAYDELNKLWCAGFSV